MTTRVSPARGPSGFGRPFSYPDSRADDVVDDYHGTRIADPYRWLEQADSDETRAWVDRQNALTASLLQSPERPAIRDRLTDLYDFPRQSAPSARGGRLFFTRNDGLQNHAVLFVAEGTAARVLLDPNAWSPDGTVALTGFSPSEDGRRLGYAVSHRGSDRQEIRVRDVESGGDLTDTVRYAKFTDITWTKDGSGFYYTRFPTPGTVAAGDENYFAAVYLHQLGEPQERDVRIFDRPNDREAVMSSAVSDDGRWLIVSVFRGASDDCEVYVADLLCRGSAPAPLFTGFAAAYAFVDGLDQRLYFRTTSGASNGRVIAVDVSNGVPSPGPSGEPVFATLIAEREDHLSAVRIVNRQFVAVYLHHASDRIHRFDLAGQPLGNIDLPAIGSLSGLTGQASDAALFLRWSSFTVPPTVYRYDFAIRTLAEWRAPEAAGAAPSSRGGSTAVSHADYEVSQVWYASKDGTRVSMFLVGRRDLPRDGARPVLLTAYGGFNVSITPQYDPALFVWLERGGLVAVPNLRGGGEYGDAWHRAGMLERKQNVFDDFIAAAEWLVAEGHAAPWRIAIEGGSNGGLLVAAAMVQRPDLFGAVICRVPVVDMLRYHRFTVGRFWIPEYGSADDAAQFPYLLAYSPLHNVTDGVRYPPTLIMTADTDDRVDPGMARKFAARLQAAMRNVSDAGPILIRVETKAGHGAGKPIAKLVDEDADIYAFLFAALQPADGPLAGSQLAG